MALWSKKYWKLFFQPKRDLVAPTWQDVLIPWKWSVKEPIYRYYHAFRKGELSALFPKKAWSIETSGYIRNGERVWPWQGKNLVLVAKKSV